MSRWLRVVLPMALLGAAVVPLGAQAASSSSAWKPGPRLYGADGERTNISVPMDDGTTIKVNHYFPTVKGTTRPAKGKFPTLLITTAYGKGVLGTSDPYFIERGYHMVIADIRGTGSSEGYHQLFDGNRQGRDGATIVRWIARNVPNSNGKVGMLGESYLGLTQLHTAAAVGKNSPLKAIFPIVPNHDGFRDGGANGGQTNFASAAFFYALVAGLNTANPIRDAGDNGAGYTVNTSGQHAGSTVGALSGNVTDQMGSDARYDGPVWANRSPRHKLARIVANGVPAFMVAGWRDVFLPRAHLLNYGGLQNGWAGRPVDAPMTPGQPVTGRYQLLMGPDGHTGDQTGIQLKYLQLKWFDTWLKGARTGMASTKTPLHMAVVGTNKYVDTAYHPFLRANHRPYYFTAGPSGSGSASANDGVLSTVRPSAATGADPLVWTVNNGCSNSSAHTMLVGSEYFESCKNDERLTDAGPGAVAYTTAALKQDQLLAGPITASVNLTSTSRDAYLVVRVSDVAPDGTARGLTWGTLQGAFREVSRNPNLTWRDRSGNIIKPFHPFTRASEKPIPAGATVRLDIEVQPVVALLAKGHRLRITLNSSDFPHESPATVNDRVNLLGGVYQIQRHRSAPSFVNLPFAPVSAFVSRCRLCAERGPTV